MVCLLSLEAGTLSTLQSRWPWCTASRSGLCQTCPAVWRNLSHITGYCCPLGISFGELGLWLQWQCALFCAVLPCSCRGLRGDQMWLCHTETRGG